MLVERDVVRIDPVAGIPIVHELTGGIELDRSLSPNWPSSEPTSAPVVIRHERGDALPRGMRAVLDVPPWCTFLLDSDGEPAAAFHAVFGDVQRLLRSEESGATYVIRYGDAPPEPVVPLQSELVAFSFALSARGLGLIAHSCAFVAPNGGGVLCPGISGTGKTTLARLLREHAPMCRVLTDDRAIVTSDARGVFIWGTPWPGAAQIADARSAQLQIVLFIKHGGACTERELAPRDAFRRIVNTLSVPLWEPARCGAALDVIDAIVSRAALIEIGYPPTQQGIEWLLDVVQRAQPLGTPHVG